MPKRGETNYSKFLNPSRKHKSRITKAQLYPCTESSGVAQVQGNKYIGQKGGKGRRRV